ncbi:hypothetical protein [Chitinophaga silvatica]|nr:hypothetical protein [Chitinophaga silvatica]
MMFLLRNNKNKQQIDTAQNEKRGQMLEHLPPFIEIKTAVAYRGNVSLS